MSAHFSLTTIPEVLLFTDEERVAVKFSHCSGSAKSVSAKASPSIRRGQALTHCTTQPPRELNHQFLGDVSKVKYHSAKVAHCSLFSLPPFPKSERRGRGYMAVGGAPATTAGWKAKSGHLNVHMTRILRKSESLSSLLLAQEASRHTAFCLRDTREVSESKLRINYKGWRLTDDTLSF